MQRAAVYCLGYELVESRLRHWAAACLDLTDLDCVDVHPADVVTTGGQASGRDGPNVAKPNHYDLHPHLIVFASATQMRMSSDTYKNPDRNAMILECARHKRVFPHPTPRCGGANIGVPVAEERPLLVNPVPAIAGVLLFMPSPHVDERGFFSRTFDAAVMRAAGIDPAAFVQDSLSRSARGVVRGLHVRCGKGEAKLVRCSYGAIFDVVVDLRPASPTRGNWKSFELRDHEQISLYVPAGCAHGFQALTDPADVSYRIDRAHDPAEDVSVAFDDPELAIPWPLPVATMSRRDREAPPLADAMKMLA
jgi:dTDP-4-dehydrorhamnose 3,5-epimerase